MAFPPDHLMRDKHRPCRNTCCIPRDVCRYGNSYSPDVVRWQSLCLWNVSAIDASQQELEQTLFCLRSLQKLAVSRLLLLVAVFCRYLCHIFFIQLFCIGIIAGKAKQPTILLSRRRMWSQTMSSVLQKNTLKSHAQIIIYLPELLQIIASNKRSDIVIVNVLRYLPLNVSLMVK